MRGDEEEILIRDDSGLLYDDSVTVSVRPRPADWCHKITKTLCLSLAFFVLGLCIAVPGPTLLDLAEKIDTDITHISTIFSARAVGYLLGAIVGGALFSYFDKQLLMFCTLLICSIATIAVPWCFTLVAMGTLVALQGLSLGILYTGGNIFCVKLWGRRNAQYLQTLHFAFAVGAFLAPVLAKPFLSNENLFTNATAVTNDETSLLNKTRDLHVRSALYNQHFNYFNERSGSEINELKSWEYHEGNKNRYKRDSPGDSQLTTTSTTTTVKSTLVNTAIPVADTIKPAVNISLTTTVAQNPVTGLDANATEAGTTSASVTKTSILTTTATSTAKAKKPAAASDAFLKEHTAGAKQMSDLQTEKEEKASPEIPPVETVNNVGKTSEKPETPGPETPISLSTTTASPAGSNITGNQSEESGPAQTVTPAVDTGLSDGNRALKNGTEEQSSSGATTTTTIKTSTTVNKTAVPETVQPTARTTHSSTTTATTSRPATTSTATTTTQAPTTTTKAPPTTRSTTEKQMPAIETAKPPETLKPSETSKQQTSSQATTAKSMTEILSKPKTMSPVTETSINTSKSAIVSSTAVITTEAPKKPTTAEDIFNKAISLVKTISKIQFVYAIIGTVALIMSFVFLILYCRNKKRLTLNDGDDYYEGVKSNGGCFRGTVLLMMLIFFICYTGLEVAFGGLVTTFTVRFNHWPKEQGAIVTAIFWGSVGAGRGISIFIARCCRPTIMLAIDLCLMVLGGLVLSVGTYFYAKLLWLGSFILGLGMSSVLPGIISWTESYFSTAGKATAVFVVGSVLGEMFIPILTTYLFTLQDEMVLMRLALAMSAIMLILFIVMGCYAAKNGETYTVRDRNGFLPLQAEDNDNDENVEMDLMDFEPAKSRRRKTKQRGDTEYKTLISDLEED